MIRSVSFAGMATKLPRGYVIDVEGRSAINVLAGDMGAGTRVLIGQKRIRREGPRGGYLASGGPEEIAALCGYLCSEQGGFTSGQMIACNGAAQT